MPRRKDQALSPVVSPSSPDSSRRGWDWMKGKFQRRISGKFRNLANGDSQDLTSFDSPDPAQPSSQISSSTTVIEKAQPTNGQVTRDSQLERASQNDDVIKDDRSKVTDNASLEDKTYDTLEKEPGMIVFDERPLLEISDDSPMSSSPEIDLNKAEDHVAPGNGLPAISTSNPMSIWEQQMLKIRSLGANDSEICKRILSVVALAHQPLNLNELAVLADLPSTSESEPSKFIGECSFCLALQNDGTVCFAQQEVKEYLLDEAFSEIFPKGLKGQHHVLYSRSLQAMAVGLQRDIYNLREPGCLIDDVNIPIPDPLKPLRYACLHWVEHLILSEYGEQDLKQGGAIDMFLQRDYLHWIEALSLLRKMSDGVFWMLNLEQLVTERRASPSLIDRTRDAYRFIQHHKATIEESPLQAYSSALVFSPVQSITRNQFEHEGPSWIETKPILEDDWNSCLLTLDGHEGAVLALSWISNDRIASASQDGTSKIWDISTSRCLSTLEGDGTPISSVGRLRNAELGFSLSDGRIWTWRATESNSTQTHSEHVLSSHGDILSFKDTVESFVAASWSSKGTLAFVDENETIWIRHFMHMARDQPLFSLNGHHRGVVTLAWSHDGRLASGANDGTIKIWDAVDGECKLSPSGHSEGIYSLAWSQDGQRLASASKESIIKIWNTQNGRCMAWIQGQSQLIRSLSWSPDGRLAGADGDTIRIWDSATGKCRSRLEGHTHQVWSVTWSEDGSKLASASRDKTIKIWDTAADQKQSHPLGHSQRVKSIAWSADKTKLASVSSDDTVVIWNAFPVGDVHTLTENVSDVRSLAWSKDTEKLALIDGHNTIAIWNTITGELEKTLTGGGDDIESIVWSEDGTKLASTSGNRKVEIWDISSETRLGATLEDNSSENQIAWSDKFAEPETPSFVSNGSTRLKTYGIDSYGTWITSQGKRQLKLPPGYNIECLTILPERIGIGCGSGRVLTFAVSEDRSM